MIAAILIKTFDRLDSIVNKLSGCLLEWKEMRTNG